MAEAEIRYGVAPFPNETLRGADAGDGAPRGGAGGLSADADGPTVTPDRDALITGIGLVSCLGEGADAHWAALDAPGGFTPGGGHRRASRPGRCIRWSSWSWTSKSPSAATSGRWRPGSASACYAAGLALDAAGVKGNAELLERMDMIVAAGGGERDYAADEAILAALPARRRSRARC